jgi:predicted AlkP superfamily pyrophosphatase or phosphodiesterase
MIFRILVSCLVVTQLALSSTPRLVILLCYDQLRADRIDVVRPWLSEGGFLRLMREGVVADRCMFNYATTVTAAGHATISTGCNPNRHGIVDNDFVIGGRVHYATDDTLLGVPSPRLLLVPTLGDYMKAANPSSKVWSFSHKDRAAIFLGGHRPDGAYWLVPHRGLGTSIYYPPEPAWINDFNQSNHPAHDAGTTWVAVLPPSAPPDTIEWEGRFPQGTNVFPHRIPLDTSTDAFWRAFALTPNAVEWVFRAARSCIEQERLGADTVPDLLCISVSTTDLVGHLFGHDSREYAELLVACDRILAAFLDELDRRIGRDNYLLVLTSDHGAGSIPELERSRGFYAGRIHNDTLVARIERWFGQKAKVYDQRIIQYFFPPWLWLNQSVAQEASVPYDSLCSELAHWLTLQEGIGFAVTAREITTTHDSAGVVALIARSFRSDRCGDIAIYPKERWIFGSTPAQHGTFYDYDRSVPLIFYGATLKPGSISGICSPADIVPTIAKLLDIPLQTVDGKPLPLPFPIR